MNLRIAKLFLTVLVTSGCASQLQEIENEGGDCEAMPVYVAEAFERSCAIPACHDGSAQSPALTANAAPSIIGGSAAASALPLVEQGNLLGSYVAIKMLDVALLDDPALRVGDVMPPPGQMPDPADITLILGWIAGSAPVDCGGGSGSSGGDGVADTAGSESTGTPEPQLCGVEDVAVSTPTPVVMGDEADVIPTQIGMIIEANCGCHLATDLIPGASKPLAPPPVSSGSDLSTLAGIRESIDKEFGGIQTRIVDSPAAMPPPNFCSVQEVQALTQADFDALSMWLEMGAPDGATWTGG